MHRVVIAEPYSKVAIDALRRIAQVEVLRSCEEAAILDAVADADALLVRTYARVTARVMEHAPRLRVIGRGGVGLENIDLRAARARNIAVVYTPAAATHSVAELTIGLMIALERRILPGDESVRTGRFLLARESTMGRELHGLTMGIVGLGRIGTCVARLCALGLGMRVCYNDILDIRPAGFPAEPVSKDELFRTADVVSLHVPLTQLTRGLIDEPVLATFKPTTTLINTARGAVVDLAALAAALAAGRLAGAALEVFEPEPPPPDHPILAAPNVLFSPHMGARTREGQGRMNDVVHDVIAVLEGRVPRYPAPTE